MSHATQSRRSILVAGASGAAAVLLGKHTPAMAAESAPAVKPVDRGKTQTPSIKLSLAGYSYKQFLDKPGKSGEMSLFDLVDLCAELGLDGVEPTSYYFLKTDDEFIYALKRKIILAGLVNTGMPIRTNFAFPDGEAFDNELKQLKGWVDVAAKLGAPNMRVFAGGANKDLSREAAFPQIIKGLKAGCAYAATKGVFLAIENHGYQTETADDVIRIIEAVDHPWMGANLDTGNFSSQPYENVRKLAPYAVVAQFKTLVAGAGPKERQPADYARLFQILRDVKYRGFVALEYEGTDARKEVPVEIRKMQAALHG